MLRSVEAFITWLRHRSLITRFRLAPCVGAPVPHQVIGASVKSMAIVVGDTYVLWESSSKRRDGVIRVLACQHAPSWPVLATCTVRALTTIVTWIPSPRPTVQARYQRNDVFCVPIAHLHPLGVRPQCERRLIHANGQPYLS